jgi:hypothetical protein
VQEAIDEQRAAFLVDLVFDGTPPSGISITA